MTPPLGEPGEPGPRCQYFLGLALLIRFRADNAQALMQSYKLQREQRVQRPRRIIIFQRKASRKPPIQDDQSGDKVLCLYSQPHSFLVHAESGPSVLQCPILNSSWACRVPTRRVCAFEQEPG